MTDTAMARCSRTAGIVEAILAGDEAALDRAHLAGCASCTREAEHATQFTRGLSATAVEASEGIPDAALLERERTWLRGQRTGRLTLRILNVGRGGGGRPGHRDRDRVACAGTDGPGTEHPSVRRLPPQQPPTGSHGPGLWGAGRRGGVHVDPRRTTCIAVLLTLEDGQVVRVEARIDSTEGGPLKLDGADWMFARFAAAVLTPEMRSDVAHWLGDEFAACGTSCSADIDDVHLELSKGTESVVMTLAPR